MSTPDDPGRPHEDPAPGPPPYQQQYPPPYQQQFPPAYQQQQYGPEQYPPQQYPPQQYPPQPYPPQQYAPEQYPPQQYDPGQYPPQYGGQPYGWQSAPPPRPGRRTPLFIAGAAVLVVALVVVGVVLLTRGGGGGPKKNAQPPVHPSTSSTAPSSTAPTSTAPTSPATSTSPPATSSAPASTVAAPPPDSVKRITVPPLISGWHGVLSPKEKVAYDVPPGWKVETPGTLVGFENNKGRPIAIMHGVSTYRSDACPTVPGSYRGHTGFATAGDLAPTAAARAGVSVFARGVALRDNGSRAPISRTQLAGIRVDRGKIEAEYARATVSLNDKSDCGSPSVVVVAVAFRTGPHATALFIGYFDQGVHDALRLSTARKIFTTLRPYTR